MSHLILLLLWLHSLVEIHLKKVQVGLLGYLILRVSLVERILAVLLAIAIVLARILLRLGVDKRIGSSFISRLRI